MTISDDVQTGVLDVYKTDNGTKQPLANAVFEVRAAKDFSIGSKQLHKAGDLICTMTTGADGHADSGDAEMYIGAEYTLTEINAPEGYTLNSDSPSISQVTSLNIQSSESTSTTPRSRAKFPFTRRVKFSPLLLRWVLLYP